MQYVLSPIAPDFPLEPVHKALQQTSTHRLMRYMSNIIFVYRRNKMILNREKLTSCANLPSEEPQSLSVRPSKVWTSGFALPSIAWYSAIEAAVSLARFKGLVYTISTWAKSNLTTCITKQRSLQKPSRSAHRLHQRPCIFVVPYLIAHNLSGQPELDWFRYGS